MKRVREGILIPTKYLADGPEIKEATTTRTRIYVCLGLCVFVRVFPPGQLAKLPAVSCRSCNKSDPGNVPATDPVFILALNPLKSRSDQRVKNGQCKPGWVSQCCVPETEEEDDFLQGQHNR